jgi:hypothetical protein
MMVLREVDLSLPKVAAAKEVVRHTAANNDKVPVTAVMAAEVTNNVMVTKVEVKAAIVVITVVVVTVMVVIAEVTKVEVTEVTSNVNRNLKVLLSSISPTL